MVRGRKCTGTKCAAPIFSGYAFNSYSLLATLKAEINHDVRLNYYSMYSLSKSYAQRANEYNSPEEFVT